MAQTGSIEPSGADRELLLRKDEDGIATLTLNRPAHYNALSEALIDALQREFDALAEDDAVRVVIVAAGGKAFSAGHDLKEMRAQATGDGDEHRYRDLFARCSRMMMRVLDLPQPVIAEVQGTATAAGCQLVAMCDLAVASERARFAVSGINLGLFCATPSVALSRNIGRKRAMEMLLTGEFISARQALDYGLINQVVPDDALADRTLALAKQIAAKSRQALRMGKQLFYSQLEQSLEQAYHRAGAVMACNILQPETQEGIEAFIGKRSPGK